MAYDPKASRRRYRGEQHYFPLLDELGHAGLRRALIRRGISPQLAQGIVFFLDDQRALDRHQSESARFNYRAILLEHDVDELRRAGRDAERLRLVSA